MDRGYPHNFKERNIMAKDVLKSQNIKRQQTVSRR